MSTVTAAITPEAQVLLERLRDTTNYLGTNKRVVSPTGVVNTFNSPSDHTRVLRQALRAYNKLCAADRAAVLEHLM